MNTCQRKETRVFAIINAEIETITKGRISKGTILVEDGKIRFVGRNVRIPKGAEVVDAGGRTVTPGLIEAHSHAGITEDGFLADADINESTDPVTPHLLAIDGFKPTDIAMLEAASLGCHPVVPDRLSYVDTFPHERRYTTTTDAVAQVHAALNAPATYVYDGARWEQAVERMVAALHDWTWRDNGAR